MNIQKNAEIERYSARSQLFVEVSLKTCNMFFYALAWVGCLALSSSPTHASTILERVLGLTRNLSGLFLNTAQSYVPSGPRPAIDGSISLDISRGILRTLDQPSIDSISGSSVMLHHLNTTAFSAINAGDVIVGSVTLGLVTAPSENTRKGLDELLGSSTSIGENAFGRSAKAGQDVSVQNVAISVPGTDEDARIIVMNLAANTNSVTSEILVKVGGVSAQLGDLSATAGGVINSGKAMVGLESMRSALARTVSLSE